MKTVSVDRASENLVALIHEVTECSEPIQILNGVEDAVLVSADDWRSIQETFSDDPGWD